MRFATVLQISKYDSNYGFDPKFVIDGPNPHLLDLLTQMNSLKQDSQVSIITGQNEADKKIENLASTANVNVISLPEDDYISEGVLHLQEKLDVDFYLFFSAYTALIDSSSLNEILVEQKLKDKLYVQGLHWKRKNWPAIIHSKAVQKAIQHAYPNKQDFNFSKDRPHDFPGSWLINPKVPYWLFPPRLILPLVHNYRNRRYHPSTQNLLSTKNRKNELMFRNIISTNSEEELWSDIKKDRSTPYDYEQCRETYFNLAPIKLNTPTTIQWDFGKERSLIPYSSTDNYQENKVTPELVHEKVMELDLSPLYQTYFQLGVYYDSIAEQDFGELIKNLDDDRLALALRTRGLDLGGTLINQLVANCREIFFYIGAEEKNYNQLYKDGSYKKAIYKFNLLKNKIYEKNIDRNQSKNIGLAFPTLSAVFFTPPNSQLNTKSLYFDEWLDWQGFKSNFKERYGQKWNDLNWKKKIEKFYGIEKSVQHFIIKSMPECCISEKSQKKFTTASEYEPLKRKRCIRLVEGLTIHNDGSMTVCSKDLNKNLKIGNLKENSIDQAWKDPLRKKLVKAHREENFSINETCAGCSEWYKPIL